MAQIYQRDVIGEMREELKEEYFDKYDEYFKGIDNHFIIVFKALDKMMWRIKELFVIMIVILLFVLGLAVMFAVKIHAYEYTPKEIVHIGRVTNNEAENQSELGKRLVIDTVLNRVESDEFPNTVEDVLTQDGQYCNPKGYPDEDMYRLVAEEIYNRTNSDVLWYRTKRYHTYGEPLLKEGDHYFSGTVDK